MRLLDIPSSPRGESSDSIALTKSFIAACKPKRNSVVVDTLNVWHYAKLGLLYKLLHVDDPQHPTTADIEAVQHDLIDAIQDARRGAPDLSNRLQSDAAKQARKAGIAVRAALEAQWRNA